ncbi:Uncharacterised protein [Veillonella criceti]|uniref:Uncharacterized protein n=2 Tax=Veillonella criceti TaxID=103891 RepID=A0A380NL54_9FIRM|nr:Uncharacterised protein [Veillonella criceti]
MKYFNKFKWIPLLSFVCFLSFTSLSFAQITYQGNYSLRYPVYKFMEPEPNTIKTNDGKITAELTEHVFSLYINKKIAQIIPLENFNSGQALISAFHDDKANRNFYSVTIINFGAKMPNPTYLFTSYPKSPSSELLTLIDTKDYYNPFSQDSAPSSSYFAITPDNPNVLILEHVKNNYKMQYRYALTWHEKDFKFTYEDLGYMHEDRNDY